MSVIYESQALQDTLNSVKENCINSIKATLNNRNHNLITFDDPLTNNKIDHVDRENIVGYDMNSNTVQIEMNYNTYNISLDKIKIEVLILMLQEIEEESYEEENYEE
jgi:hypothetical protein